MCGREQLRAGTEVVVEAAALVHTAVVAMVEGLVMMVVVANRRQMQTVQSMG
jgi:hypothetical protein